MTSFTIQPTPTSTPTQPPIAAETRGAIAPASASGTHTHIKPLRDLASAALPAPILFHLPVEILHIILQKLDACSALNFLATCSTARNTCAEKEKRWLVFEKQCLVFLQKKMAKDPDIESKHTQHWYQQVLTQLLQQDMSEHECEKAANLAEKFFSHLPRKAMQICLNQVLTKQPTCSNWQQIFERLAHVNLHLCVTLITLAVADFDMAKVHRLQVYMRGKKITYPFTDYYAFLTDKLQFNPGYPAKRLRPDVYAADNIRLDNNIRAEQFFRQIRTIDHHYNTALHFAVAHGYADILPALTRNPHGIDLVDSEGKTALISICAQNRLNPRTKQLQLNYTEIVRTLLERKADPNRQDSQGGNALMYISRQNDLAILDLLLRYGAQVNQLDNCGKNALFYAYRAEIVSRLITHSINVNQQSNTGMTALMRASSCGPTDKSRQHYLAMADVLLKHGADVDLQDAHGWSALIYAAQQGNIDTIRLLLQHNASINLQDEHGLTAFMHACQKGNISTVHFLLEQNHIKRQDPARIRASLVMVEAILDEQDDQTLSPAQRSQYQDIWMQLRLQLPQHTLQNKTLIAG